MPLTGPASGAVRRSFSVETPGAARIAVLAATIGLGAMLAACGADGGTSAFLPPGEPTTAPPGNLVLYAAMAQGDRIDAYRLGTDGLLPSEPFDSISVANPRRLAIANGVLYATLFDRIVSIRLGADGSLPPTTTSHSDTRNDYDPIAIEVRNDIVYVAAAGLARVQSYELDGQGNLPVNPTGAGASEIPGDYSSLVFNGNFLYAGARDSQVIDLFILDQDGNVPFVAEALRPQDGISLADDMIIRDGILYVTSGSDKSIRAYEIQPGGELSNNEDSQTKTEEFYSDILIDGDTLYAAAYNAGRIDLYTIDDDGMLPEDPPFESTKDDPEAYPSKMLLNNGILYVAQAGLGRIDAYALDNQGRPPRFPTSSTNKGRNGPFPLDIQLYSID